MPSPDRVKSGARSLLPGLAVAALALGVWLPACNAQAPQDKAKPAGGDPKKVLAMVDGQQITEADVYQQAAAELQNLDREYNQNRHQLIEAKLRQTVQDRMVEAEAKAKGVSKEQLLADAVKSAAVTDADVDKFYEENKSQIPRPKEQVAPQIKQYLEQQRQREAQTAFIQSLEAKYKADYLLEPIRVQVASEGFPSKGPANAPVTIVEFSEFQCPFCSRVVPTLEQVRAKYGDKVRVVFRHFPLAFHQNAQKASEASMCANDQGKFWEMHDAMFANQQALGVDQLKEQAAKLGLNAESFNSCLDSGKHAAAVKADLDAGTAAGVSGTPAMFVNGRFISGAVPLEQITQVVDDELRRIERGQGKGK